MTANTTDAPWDTSPASKSQLTYVSELLTELSQFDWATRDTTMVTQAIDGLNKARRAAGIPFRDFM